MVGTVRELWRFPVKSMQGEQLDQVELGPGGMVGDRTWGLVSDAGHLLSAKTVPQLLWASARTEDDGRVVATLPDGTEVALGEPGAEAALSGWLDRPVRLVRAEGSHDLAYEMTFDPPDDDAEQFAIPAPAGRLHDLADLHVLTTASLAAMAARRDDLQWDVRRFRPGVLVDVDGDPAFAEDAWVGTEMALGGGGARIAVEQQAVRCALPLRAQPDGIDRQVAIYRALEDAHANHLGVYCRIIAAGTVAVGDEVSAPT